jgi:hypothetical protein
MKYKGSSYAALCRKQWARIALSSTMMQLVLAIGLTQTTDFLPFGGSFSPCRAKKNLQKKGSTMLPFVLSWGTFWAKGRLKLLYSGAYSHLKAE